VVLRDTRRSEGCADGIGDLDRARDLRNLDRGDLDLNPRGDLDLDLDLPD
jgi:hypothetical protein